MDFWKINIIILLVFNYKILIIFFHRHYFIYCNLESSVGENVYIILNIIFNHAVIYKMCVS